MVNSVSINKTNPMYFQASFNKGSGLKSSSPENEMQLSGYNVGRAILAQNNITFRNLSMPVEVTHLYNQKTEGKDHLDLPNIHVYEYPDTNLQVFVNADENINTNEQSELNSPKYTVLIENNSYNAHDLLKEKLKQTFTGERLDLIKQWELISYSDEIFSLYEIIDSVNEDDIKQYYKNLT